MMPNFYKDFEDRYRGSRELIKSRLRIYLPFVASLKSLYKDHKALDLGCGRGEWLELLKEAGVDAHGVDMDGGMLAACRELGLSVDEGDAVSYIKSLPDESQALITGFHFVEHISFADLQSIVQESLRVLKPAGLLILETPNPENLLVGTANFYLDPTHLHPLPHQLLSFVAEYSGYYRTKVLRLQEPYGLIANETPRLFDIFTGVSPDYSIVAQKRSTQEMLTVFDPLFEKEYGLTLEMLVARYEKSIDIKHQRIIEQLNSVRAELAHAEAELAHAKMELEHVRIVLRQLTAPLRFGKRLLNPILRMANFGNNLFKKVFKSS